MTTKKEKSDTSFIPVEGATPFPGYELIRLRGEGGFAEVWESTSPSGQLVALKFLTTQSISATAQELRAIRAIHSLEHPHLLKSKHVWCLPGTIVIGMELAEATLLDYFLLYNEELRQQIEIEKVLSFIYQAAIGIDFLNAHNHTFEGKTVGLQHGDIKPNNLMLIGETVKLADYGLATPIQSNYAPCHRHGTLDYVAPEVMSGKLTDWSDQFSLAVTYYVLRVGTFPFPPAPPLEEVLKKGLTRPAPNVQPLSQTEGLIIQKALSPVPQNRYPNCTQFVKALAKTFGFSLQNVNDSKNSHVLVRPERMTQRIA